MTFCAQRMMRASEEKPRCRNCAHYRPFNRGAWSGDCSAIILCGKKMTTFASNFACENHYVPAVAPCVRCPHNSMEEASL